MNQDPSSTLFLIPLLHDLYPIITQHTMHVMWHLTSIDDLSLTKK